MIGRLRRNVSSQTQSTFGFEKDEAAPPFRRYGLRMNSQRIQLIEDSSRSLLYRITHPKRSSPPDLENAKIHDWDGPDDPENP